MSNGLWYIKKDVPDNLLEALKLDLVTMADPDFEISLDFPTHSSRFEAIITNLFKCP